MQQHVYYIWRTGRNWPINVLKCWLSQTYITMGKWIIFLCVFNLYLPEKDSSADWNWQQWPFYSEEPQLNKKLQIQLQTNKCLQLFIQYISSRGQTNLAAASSNSSAGTDCLTFNLLVIVHFLYSPFTSYDTYSRLCLFLLCVVIFFISLFYSFISVAVTRLLGNDNDLWKLETAEI